MAKDVIITPADGDIQFENTTGTEAGKIEQSGDDLVLSNAVGDILIGDGTSDVYIGDGAANVDIVFEQNGSIRGEAGSSVDITLGSSDTDVIISGSTFNIDPDASFSGLINANNKLTFTTSNGYVLFDHQPQAGVGEYTSEVPLLKIDYDGSEKTILSRTSGGGAITIGADDSVVIAGGDTKAVIKTNLNLGAENVIFSSETGFHAYGFPNNSTVWANRQEFRFYTGGTDTSLNGLWIGDGGNTQFIDLNRNLKNIGTINSGEITTNSKIVTTAGGSLLRKYVSTWTNATTHDLLYQGWHTNTDDYIYLKSPGNSTTNHGVAFISDNVIAFGRTDVETGAPELTSAAAPISENWFVLNSTSATFSGNVSLTGGSLSISGDGSNAATLTESSAGILTIAAVDDIILDAEGDIALDANGGDIRLRDGGTTFGTFTKSGNNFHITSNREDGYIKFFGNDGGTSVTALTLNMADGGNATFAGTVTSPTFLGDLNGTINTATTGTTQTAGNNSTKIATTAYADAAAAAVPIGNYLPLSAGSGFPLTGDLWLDDNSGASPSLYLQNGSNNYWRLLNGSTGIFSLKEGTSDRITILPGGNVGIGNTSPSALLHVGNNYTIPSGYTGINTVLNGGVFINIFEEDTKVFGIWHDPNGEAILQIDTDPTNLFLIDPTGDNEIKVGIGTSSPSSTLEVYGSGSTVLDIQGSQGQLFSITDDLTGDLFTVSDISGVPIFNVNATGLATVDGDTIINDKLGVGGVTPTAALHITGPPPTAYSPLIIVERSSPEIEYRDVNTTNNYVQFTEKFNNAAGSTIAYRKVQQNPGGTGIYTVYDTGALSNQGTEYVQKNNSYHWKIDGGTNEVFNIGTVGGNVGVGVTTASQLLHVGGNLRLQNQLYDSTNSQGSTGQVLSKVAAGTAWADLSSLTSSVGGSGTNNTVPLWNGTTGLDNSNITQTSVGAISINETSPANATEFNIKALSSYCSMRMKGATGSGADIAFLDNMTFLAGVAGVPGGSMQFRTSTNIATNGLALTLTSNQDAVFTGNVEIEENLAFKKPTANNQFRGEIVTFGGQGTITVGDIVYLDTSGNWQRAKADSDTTSKSLLGVAMGTTASAGILLRGFVKCTATFTQSLNPGLPFYLSNTVAGDAYGGIPSTTGHIARIVGYSIGSAEMYFCPDNTFVEIA